MKPISTSTYTFSDLIGGGYVYVDKTANIHAIAAQAKGQYFIARPRRFGTSLLISTLRCLFQGGPVALGAKGAIPCCADFDKDGAADFATYMSKTKAPYFTRLPRSTKFRETWTLPMGSKGDAPVVGVYEDGQPAAPAVWTGTKWTYVTSDYTDCDLLDE